MMMMTCLIGDAVGTVFAASAAHARSAAARAVMQAPSANLYLKFPIAESIHRSLRWSLIVERGRMLGTSDVTCVTLHSDCVSCIAASGWWLGGEHGAAAQARSLLPVAASRAQEDWRTKTE
jgi:hypothetical protein